MVNTAAISHRDFSKADGAKLLVCSLLCPILQGFGVLSETEVSLRRVLHKWCNPLTSFPIPLMGCLLRSMSLILLILSMRTPSDAAHQAVRECGTMRRKSVILRNFWHLKHNFDRSREASAALRG